MKHSEVVEAYKRNNNSQTATALELGVARSTVQWHLSQAAIHGEIAPELRLTPVGFNVKRLTQHVRKEGDAVKLTEEWTQFTPDSATYEATLSAIDEVMKQHEGVIPQIIKPSSFANTDLATFYPIIDHHLGLYSWEPETGANYDLTISQKIQIGRAHV